MNKVYGQFSVIQDGSGETSFQLFRSNTIAINTENTSIGFSLRPKEIQNKKGESYWTIVSVANAKKGTSNLFKGGEFQLSGKIGSNIVWDKTNYPSRANENPGTNQKEVNFIYTFVGGELLYSRYSVFDSKKAFDDQIYEQTDVGFRVNYGWNVLNVKFGKSFLKYLGSFTAGISSSIGMKDNTDIIDQIEVVTSLQSFGNGNTIRTLSNSRDAYELGAIETQLLFSRINFDFGKHIFNQRVFANLHLTYAMDDGLKPVLNPSIGLFVTEVGAPLEAIVGIQMQASDWSNNRNSEKGRWERSAILLTVGFPFN